MSTSNKMQDLESARIFMAVAKSGSIRSAADELFMSQSTISRRIQSFEENFGAKLFIRKHEGISLTDVGRRVVTACRSLEGVTAQLNSISAGLKNEATITFSASDGIAGYWLPIILSKFPEDHPDITLQVKCRDVGSPLNLSEAEADIDVSYIPPTNPDVVVLGKATMEGRMFGSKAYLDKHGYPETLNDLNQHRVCIMDHFLNPMLGKGDWEKYARLLAQHKSITYQTNSALALGFAIRSGWGLGSQPSLVEVTEPGMVMLPKEVYSVSMQFWLVAHKDLKNNPAPRLLIKWIKEHMIRSFKDGRATFEVMA